MLPKTFKALMMQESACSVLFVASAEEQQKAHNSMNRQ